VAFPPVEADAQSREVQAEIARQVRLLQAAESAPDGQPLRTSAVLRIAMPASCQRVPARRGHTRMSGYDLVRSRT
jgi:hypothetical protein